MTCTVRRPTDLATNPQPPDGAAACADAALRSNPWAGWWHLKRATPRRPGDLRRSAAVNGGHATRGAPVVRPSWIMGRR